jgi:hypothetical protein
MPRTPEPQQSVSLMRIVGISRKSRPLYWSCAPAETAKTMTTAYFSVGHFNGFPPGGSLGYGFGIFVRGTNGRITLSLLICHWIFRRSGNSGDTIPLL